VIRDARDARHFRDVMDANHVRATEDGRGYRGGSPE
jgi:hypothetical protein